MANKKKESKEKVIVKEVIVRCKTNDLMTIDEMEAFQGKLKSIPEENMQKLKNSIVNNGFRIPIMVWNKKIMDGHTRLACLKRMREDGFIVPAIPIIKLEANNEMDARKLLLLINSRYAKISEQGFYEFAESLDVADLAFEMEIPEIDLGLDDDVKETTGDDEIPADAKPITKSGDVYELNGHRLVCGDAIKKADVDKLMNGIKCDMVFTDPPWNVAYGTFDNSNNAMGYKRREIKNDNLGEKFPAFCDGFNAQLKRISKPGGMIYMVMSSQEWGTITTSMTKAGFHWSSTIIWAKDRMVLSRKDYHTQYEPIWYGWNDDAPRLAPLKDRTQTDVWNFKRPSKSDEHPMMKPVEMVQKAIINSSKREGVVVDLFGGSGTTMIASEKIGRKCFMLEMAENYVDVIVKRYINFCNTNGIKCCIKRNGKPFKQEEA